jgi:hypothetical protein
MKDLGNLGGFGDVLLQALNGLGQVVGQAPTPEGCKLMGQAHNVHLAEMLEAPAFSEEMSPKEALVIAMKREEGSHRFYQTLAGLQPPGEIRTFLEKMAQVELSHKEKVEYLYDNVAFPEVW